MNGLKGGVLFDFHCNLQETRLIFIVVKIHGVVFYVMTLCGEVVGTKVLEDYAASIFRVTQPRRPPHGFRKPLFSPVSLSYWNYLNLCGYLILK
jgi:hypothetical protein